MIARRTEKRSANPLQLPPTTAPYDDNTTYVMIALSGAVNANAARCSLIFRAGREGMSVVAKARDAGAESNKQNELIC